MLGSKDCAMLRRDAVYRDAVPGQRIRLPATCLLELMDALPTALADLPQHLLCMRERKFRIESDTMTLYPAAPACPLLHVTLPCPQHFPRSFSHKAASITA